LTITSASVGSPESPIAVDGVNYPAVKSKLTNVAVSVSVKNLGTGAASSASVKSYFSSDAKLDVNIDTECTSISVETGGIASKEVVSLNKSINIPQISISGWYYIITVIDSTPSNNESDKTNNTLATKIYVWGL